MGKINQHIEIVSSTVPSLSSMSEVSRRAVKATLSKHYQRVGITTVDNLSDLESLVSKAPDLVFLAMKFLPEDERLGINSPNKIWLADYLAEQGIATTGSPSLAHKIEVNKAFAKKCLLQDGLATSEYYLAKMGAPLVPELLPSSYPLFVKPANRGGGVGIDSDSIVNNFSELKKKVESIASDLGSGSLIERYLAGREFSVALMRGQDSGEYSTVPIELVAPANEAGDRILGSAVKESNSEQFSLEIEDEVKQSVSELAVRAFRSIGGRDYGRIDIRLDERGAPHFLEANLIPSLIEGYGSFPKACSFGLGIGYEEMLLRIVDLGMARSTDSFRVQTAVSIGALGHPSLVS